MGDFQCLDFCRGMLRVILVIVNICVAVLGLCVMAVGAWAVANNNIYFEIVAGDHKITAIPVLLVVVGIFVLLLGVVGVVGAICAGTLGGRIILGLYALVLAVVVLCELVGGILAGVWKGQLSSSFENSATDSFSKYTSDASVRDSWDSAQSNLQCCGNINYTDYQAIFHNASVPQSCCNTSAITEANGGPSCPTAANNTAEYQDFIYTQGCTSKVEDLINRNLSVITGVAIFFGLLQIVGVVVSCFVAVRRTPSNNYEIV